MEPKKLDKLLKEDENGTHEATKVTVQDTAMSADHAVDVDPNSIVVDIRSNEPIVVFFGPRSIGKTVALIRLSKYLVSNNYDVVPDKNFRKEDDSYQNLCANFDEQFINTVVAPKSTSSINFLLLKVRNTNGEICQLLEAPGEHFFDLDDYNSSFPPYLSTIFGSETPKIFVFFLELDWGNKEQFAAYQSRLTEFVGRIRTKDHLILLCNKADKQKNYINRNNPDVSKFRNDCETQYKPLFDRLGRKKGLLKFLSPDLHPFDFVVFSAGDFKDRANDDDQTMTPGPKYYPTKLWEAISSGISGRWK
jgi:hypothetical protein